MGPEGGQQVDFSLEVVGATQVGLVGEVDPEDEQMFRSGDNVMIVVAAA